MRKIKFWEIISDPIFAKEKFNFTKEFAKSTGGVVQQDAKYPGELE